MYAYPIKDRSKARLAVRPGGFTIIEVLIVLAIAGVIMAIVFLAVPAVRRSGSNNALAADARSILASLAAYASHNGSAPPGEATLVNGVVTIGDDASNQETVRVGTGVTSIVLNGTSITADDSVGTVQIVTGSSAICNTNRNGLGGSGSTRSVALLYIAEGGNGNALKCLDS